MLKKPEKKEKRTPTSEQVRSLNIAALGTFHQDLGYNRCCDKYEAYHKWDIKENYIRKPSVEEISKILEPSIENWYHRQEAAKIIIKELGGE